MIAFLLASVPLQGPKGVPGQSALQTAGVDGDQGNQGPSGPPGPKGVPGQPLRVICFANGTCPNPPVPTNVSKGYFQAQKCIQKELEQNWAAYSH